MGQHGLGESFLQRELRHFDPDFDFFNPATGFVVPTTKLVATRTKLVADRAKPSFASTAAAAHRSAGADRSA